jgi:hypothetical protein
MKSSAEKKFLFPNIANIVWTPPAVVKSMEQHRVCVNIVMDLLIAVLQDKEKSLAWIANRFHKVFFGSPWLPFTA